MLAASAPGGASRRKAARVAAAARCNMMERVMERVLLVWAREWVCCEAAEVSEVRKIQSEGTKFGEN